MRGQILILLLLGGSVGALVADTESKEKDGAPKEAVEAPKVAGNLDIKNSSEGSYPGGSTPKVGKWAVDADAKKLKIAVNPLVEGWLEFGAEIREKGATMTAVARAPGEGRLKSRFGVGLYGKNGFQLRAVLASNRLQLVRRGEVLQEVAVELVSGQAYHLELSVLEDDENWKIKGRVWPYETQRPKEALVSDRFFSDELLFPLAGRPVITATPFSGKPVAFLSATAYYGEFVTPDPKVDEGGDEKAEKDDADGKEAE